MIEVILITLFYLIVGSIEDLKKREVYDFLNYSYLGIMLTLFFLNLYFKQINFVNPLITIGILNLFSLSMLFLKQWGGGDTKLFFGLSIAISLLKIDWFKFIFDLFIYGGIYGILILIYYYLKNRKNINKIIKKKLKEKRIYVIIYLLSIFPSFVIPNIYFRSYITIWIVFFPLIFILIIGKSVEKFLFVSNKKIENIVEGDWVLGKIKTSKETIYDSQKSNGITLNQIKKIKKLIEKNEIPNKIKVKDGIAYFPAILFAFIGSLTSFSFFNLFFGFL